MKHFNKPRSVIITKISVSSLFLLFLLSVHSVITAHGVELDYLVVATSSLKLGGDVAMCSGHKVTPPVNNTWLPLNRPHGPCSSSFSASEGTLLLDDMLSWDELRTDYIRMKLASGGEENYTLPEAVTVTSTQRAQLLEADFSLGDTGEDTSSEALQSDPTNRAPIGNSVVSQTMAVDTGSDVPWVQCFPCPVPPCHQQSDQLYDPTKSTTSTWIPCGSPACRRLGIYGSGCSSSRCGYTINYGGGSATAGNYISDTLTLTPKAVVRNFRFGCSHSVRGSFSDQTAGVMALGGGTQSLLSQTAGIFGNAFSYCIASPSSSGFLSLGRPVGAASSFARTPLIRSTWAPTFYLVRLRAIIVAGQVLNVPATVFSAGSVMDSSVIVTQLPPTAYVALRAAFRYAMRMYPLAPPVGMLDTCYDFIRFTTVKVPKVALVFDGGAVLELDASSVMLDGCLAFAATSSDMSVGFIGNVQQQTYEVLYDVGGGAVGFRRGAC
ncbi:hypothetical protein ACP70R_000839 [Stipagrostis hirtigluma subsp. patula]